MIDARRKQLVCVCVTRNVWSGADATCNEATCNAATAACKEAAAGFTEYFVW